MYGLITIDDYSRYTWVFFFAHEDDTYNTFETFCKNVQNEKGICIKNIQSDHGTEYL